MGSRAPEERELLKSRIDVMEMALGDLDAVLEIEARAFPTPWSRRAFWCELTQNIYANYIVARIGGSIVGYGGMWVILDEAHVTNVAVDPLHRRQGIGRRIIIELIERAVSRGATRMTLEVRKSNLGAQKLYERMGFVAKGLRKGYYVDLKEDAIIMWKDDLLKNRSPWSRLPWFGARK